MVTLLQLLLKLKGWDRKLLPKGNHFTIKYFPAGFSFSNGFLMQNQKSFKLDYFLSRLPHFLIHTDTRQASKKIARKKVFSVRQKYYVKPIFHQMDPHLLNPEKRQKMSKNIKKHQKTAKNTKNLNFYKSWTLSINILASP